MWERSRIPPSPPPFPPWLILFPLRTPRRQVPSLSCACIVLDPFKVSTTSLRVSTAVCVSNQPPHQVHSAPFDAHSPPLSSCFKRHGIIRPILQIHCSSLKNLKLVLAPLPSKSSYSRGPAILCLIGVPHAGNLPDGGRSKGTRRRSS